MSTPNTPGQAQTPRPNDVSPAGTAPSGNAPAGPGPGRPWQPQHPPKGNQPTPPGGSGAIPPARQNGPAPRSAPNRKSGTESPDLGGRRPAPQGPVPGAPGASQGYSSRPQNPGVPQAPTAAKPEHGAPMNAQQSAPQAPIAYSSAPQAPAAQPARVPQQDSTPIVRRPESRFLPPPARAENNASPVVSRDFARIKRTKDDGPKLGRRRQIAGGLPSWDPLPPGESLVVRPGTTR